MSVPSWQRHPSEHRLPRLTLAKHLLSRFHCRLLIQLHLQLEKAYRGIGSRLPRTFLRTIRELFYSLTVFAIFALQEWILYLIMISKVSEYLYFCLDRRSSTPEVLTCIASTCHCNGILDWLNPANFRFVSMQSKTGISLLLQAGRDPYDMSSIVVVENCNKANKTENQSTTIC